MSVKLLYGIGPEDQVLHVNEVERGKDCNCICPECGNGLIARKGDKNQNHFAHSNGKECKSAPETAIHKLAKSIVHENQEIYLNGEIIFQYANSELEKPFESFIPDVTIWNKEEKIFVEIVVTNDVTLEKEEKIKETGVRTLVIDLSWVQMDICKIELEKEVLANSEIRRIIERVDQPINLVKSRVKQEKYNYCLIGILVFIFGGLLWLIFGRRKKDKLYRNRRYSKLKYKGRRERKKKFGT